MMRLIIVGGFAIRDQVKLVQHIIEMIDQRDPSATMVCVLNEADEADFSLIGIDSDKIQFFTLKGGCPCCSMAGELEHLFRSTLRGAEFVVMEVPGTCDVEQMVAAIVQAVPSVMAQCYQVLDARTVRPLLEIIPVLRSNLEHCDGVVIFGDDLDDVVKALQAVGDLPWTAPRPIDTGPSHFVFIPRSYSSESLI